MCSLHLVLFLLVIPLLLLSLTWAELTKRLVSSNEQAEAETLDSTKNQVELLLQTLYHQ